MTQKTPAPKRVATLSDVARAASVSTATVSRCLNSPERVEETTRQRVMRAVEDLSYSPNYGAKIMAARRTNTIGAVIPTMENSIFARGIQAFQEALSLEGYTLIVASSSYRADLEEEQIRNLIARGAEALLLIGYDRSDEIYEFLENRRVPVVLTWAFEDNSDHHWVGFNNQSAMEMLAEHVIGLGHNRIGAIMADTMMNDRSRARLDGIKTVMAKHNINPDTLNIEAVRYSIETGGDAFEKLMASENPPSVVMCGNDVLAVGAMQRAKEMGLKIPHDISITGFDDIELAQVVEPGLTTVHVPHSDMGRKAAEMLTSWINTNTPPVSEQLDTYICKRGTLGAPHLA